MVDPLALITVAVCAATTVRIISFRRGKSPYRFHTALCAWLLAGCIGSLGLSVHLGMQQPSPFILGIVCIVAFVIFRAKGNVASLLRVHWHSEWDGRERRRSSRIPNHY